MIQKLKPFLLVLVPFTVSLFIIQNLVIEQLKEAKTIFHFSNWSIYLFHFIATFLIYLFILFVHKTFSDKTGFAFMACSILKMMGAIVFLFPLFQDTVTSPINNVLAFFIPYFLFLGLETIFVLKILNKK